MAEPKFNPTSAGVPKEPPPGQWVCPACTSFNDEKELYCRHCAKTPRRSAKEGIRDRLPPDLPVAKDGFGAPFEFVDDNDTIDPTFQKREHNKLLVVKQISEFGRVWRKDDTKALNLRIHSAWQKLDPRPTKEAMWSTHIFVPRDTTWSSTRVDSSFRLDLDLKGVFSHTISIQKKSCQAVCCFRLDIRPHAVSGPKAFKECVKTTGVVRSVQMRNDSNHFFLEKHPHNPLVLNLNDVSGLGAPNKDCVDRARDANLVKKFSFPPKIVGLDLLTQIWLMLKGGVERFGDEFVSLALPDNRTILAFHMT